MNSSTITLLEMAATNNGFDLELPPVEGWLGYASSQVPLRVWLRGETDSTLTVAFSMLNVAQALGAPLRKVALPPGARSALAVSGFPALYELLRRGFQLARTLPDELLNTYEQKTRSLPRTTEAERLVVQRVGQNVFREGLLEYWDGKCAVTGLAVVELLRASHIKPWADCASDAERLDVFNGLLLAPHLDAAFDRGFITFEDNGQLIVSTVLSQADLEILGFKRDLGIRSLTHEHRRYLTWHRSQVFNP